MSRMPPAPGSDADDVRRGVVLAVLAYGMWGTFPLYFDSLRPAGAWEIFAHRIIWSLVFCATIMLVRRDLAWIRPTLHSRRLAIGLSAAAFLIGVNWVVYIVAVISGRTYEAALGYFLNPLVTVALGVLVLGERLRRLQWVAVGVGAVAAIYLTVAGGSFPLIPLALAFSFGLYSLIKKKVGATLTAMQSLTAETAALAPVAVVTLTIITAQGRSTFLGYGAAHTVLLIMAGVVTAVPLLMFAAAARRVPLVTIGLIQFLTPVMQLLIGVVMLDEHLTRELWVGFGIVWVALLLLTVDSLTAGHQARRDPGQAGPIAPVEPV